MRHYISELEEYANNEEQYHSDLLDALVVAVVESNHKKLIKRTSVGGTTTSLWLTKEDWELAYLKCKRYFTKIKDKNKVEVLNDLNDLIYYGVSKNNNTSNTGAIQHNPS